MWENSGKEAPTVKVWKQAYNWILTKRAEESAESFIKD